MRDLLSEIEQRLDRPTARGLAAAVSRAVSERALAPGTKLPPIRTVAAELALSPTTVSAAWSQLTRSGVVRTDGRRGTTVADGASGGERYKRALGKPVSLAQDLSTGVPDGALLPGLGRVLSTLETAGTPSSYLEGPVLTDLEALLRHDWPYEPEALTVVDGAMDALDVVTRTQLRFGDRVVVEHPGFPPVVDLLEALNIEVLGVPVDDEGLDATALAAALARAPVAAVVVQPRAQNPTGVSMTLRRAEHLAAVLRPSDALVIEDDSTHGLSRTPAISLGEWLPDRTLHIRSFSKSHGPDLRLAALSGNSQRVHTIEARRHLGQGWSSRLLQRILVGLLTDPEAVAAVDRARDVYDERRTLLVDALAAHEVEVGGEEGLNIWVPVHDESAAIVRLASQGIGVSAGAPFAVLPEPRGFIRVTAGLVPDRHAEIATVIAEAAHTGGWGSRAR
ncbi:MAG TPA: aminotransferase class I/II-fold pyridoxal phosphate-dependent enzyme [Marmoricola sp.]|nr:aminotransferase class I/II-fold pyridoxal phosphate-dependent enzyme [Marmoricola sp.]